MTIHYPRDLSIASHLVERIRLNKPSDGALERASRAVKPPR